MPLSEPSAWKFSAFATANSCLLKWYNLFLNFCVETDNSCWSYGNSCWSYGGHLLGVRCLWRHNLTSYLCYQTNVLAKFVDTIVIFFHMHSPYFVCHCTEYKLSALQVISEGNTLNATTQQFITAKISGCALQQGSETYSSPPQSNLQLQNAHKVRKKSFVFLLCVESQANF